MEEPHYPTTESHPPPRGSGVNVFHCQKCPKTYTRPESLSRHLQTHSSVKRYVCSVCKSSFSRSDLLSRHEKIHSRTRTRTRTTRSCASMGSQQSSIADQASTQTVQRNHPQNGDVDFEENHIDAVLERTADFVPFPTTRPHRSPGRSSEMPEAHRSPLSHSLRVHDAPMHGLIDDGIPGIHHLSSTDPFDTTFGELQVDHTFLLQDWFDQTFYDALHETDISLIPEIGEDSAEFNLHYSTSTMQPITIQPPAILDGRNNMSTNQLSSPAPASRAPSPPNEASEEDRWPFTWNPRSRRILTAPLVEIPEDHALSVAHRPRFDISATKYNRVTHFLTHSKKHDPPPSSVQMPTLRTANIFISLFFEQFEPRMPVLHRPSLLHTDRLHDALIAIMIVIGAIHSRQKHSTRFAIVLLDMARLGAQSSMEHDDSLMRDTMFIYAANLICYVGLWCGNKRAFELAEMSRGAVVNLCRRSHFASTSPSQAVPKALTVEGSPKEELRLQWVDWIERETKKRLCWTVFSIDCQAASLLFVPPALSITEIRKLECPCDEEFWHASSAKRWKRLLGTASCPPSRAFSSALAPFLGPLHKAQGRESQPRVGTVRADETLAGLNSWSRLLVLHALQHAVYKLSEDTVMATSDDVTDSDSESESHTKMLGLGDRRQRLEGTLSAWSRTCLTMSPPDTSIYESSQYFFAVSNACFFNTLLSLKIQISDLQDCLGKSGSADMIKTLGRLSSLYQSEIEKTIAMVMDCKKFVKANVSEPSSEAQAAVEISSGPEVFIGLFLSYVFMWTVAKTASLQLRQRLLALLPSTHSDQRTVEGMLQYALHPKPGTRSNVDDVEMEGAQNSELQAISAINSRPTIILRNGAETLSRLRPWGACLNLALLLRSRAQM